MNNQRPNKKSIAILWTLVVLIWILGLAKAQEYMVTSGRSIPIAPVEAPGPIDPAELEAFQDNLLGRQMRDCLRIEVENHFRQDNNLRALVRGGTDLIGEQGKVLFRGDGCVAVRDPKPTRASGS